MSSPSTPSHPWQRWQVGSHPFVPTSVPTSPSYSCPPTGSEAEAKLRALGFGYRARFVSGTARAIAEGMGAKGLCQLRAVPYAEARRVLCALPGVGAKVGDGVGMGTGWWQG